MVKGNSGSVRDLKASLSAPVTVSTSSSSKTTGFCFSNVFVKNAWILDATPLSR
jgi:hypothetical protein